MKTLSVILFSMILVGHQVASAESIQISTSKQVYNYGDYLSVIITVSKNTGSDAIMHIVDSSGTKSSAIPVKIKDLSTTITTPAPFNSEIFKEGRYKLEISYDGARSFTEFDLVDAGNMVMPFGSNIVVSKWASGEISDYLFLKFLAEKNIIDIPNGQAPNDATKIPDWFKANGLWWTEQKITDEEFTAALQYLIDRKFVLV